MIGCSKPLEEWPDRVRSLGFVGIVLAYSFLMFSLNEPESKSMSDRCSAHRLLPEQRPLQTQPLPQTRIYSPSQSHSGIYSSQHQRPSRWKNRQECGVIPTSTYFLASQKPRTRKGRMHLLAWLVVMPVTQSPRQNQLDHFGRPATITCGTLSVCCYFYTSYPSLLHSSSGQGGHLSEQVQEPNGDAGPGPEGCSSHAVKNPTVDRLRGI